MENIDNIYRWVGHLYLAGRYENERLATIKDAQIKQLQGELAETKKRLVEAERELAERTDLE